MAIYQYLFNPPSNFESCDTKKFQRKDNLPHVSNKHIKIIIIINCATFKILFWSSNSIRLNAQKQSVKVPPGVEEILNQAALFSFSYL